MCTTLRAILSHNFLVAMTTLRGGHIGFHSNKAQICIFGVLQGVGDISSGKSALVMIVNNAEVAYTLGFTT